jgi:orotidine-5'-phosphate decarboxylase
MRTNEQILERMKTNDTLLCCGLDPDLKKMPLEIMREKSSDEEKVLDFLQSVVDITAPHVCAYKAQKAFFDVLAGGHDVLKRLINYIHTLYSGIPIIVDCKIGDIENTMAVYIQDLFISLQADGIVVNPYMGDDVILPLVEWVDKSIVVLVKTSNTSGSIVQDVVLQNGQPFWYYILDLVVNRWNYNKNIIPVLPSTAGLNMAKIRPLIPEKMPILLAGVGAQGGHYSNLHNWLNSEGIGVLVNSSRSILYPRSHQPWQIAIKQSVIKLKNDLNNARKSYE